MAHGSRMAGAQASLSHEPRTIRHASSRVRNLVYFSSIQIQKKTVSESWHFSRPGRVQVGSQSIWTDLSNFLRRPCWNPTEIQENRSQIFRFIERCVDANSVRFEQVLTPPDFWETYSSSVWLKATPFNLASKSEPQNASSWASLTVATEPHAI